MSERLAEIERRMRVCLSDIEELRAKRLALCGVSYPNVARGKQSYTSAEEWERRAKIALLEGKIKALEMEYTALGAQKVAAELENRVDREIARAKQETSPAHSSGIGHRAHEAVGSRLEEAREDARRDLREVRLRFMTAEETQAYERRQDERRREREQEQEHGHER